MKNQLASMVCRLTGVEYALATSSLHITQHSAGLDNWADVAPPLQGVHLSAAFPEFIGSESYLESIATGRADAPYRIERIWRDRPDGRMAYITLEAHPFSKGLLLLVRDVTAEGMLEQRITQTRNELSLLSRQLRQSSTRLNTLIRRFVPSAVVDEMLRDENKALPGGARREISVVFADVRNFTHWAEARPPEAVLAMLNHLWAMVLDTTAEYGGTINQFMGDGVMIMFNAPERQPEHAAQALRCARALADICLEGSDLRFGVGVNTGEVVVGNIGARERLSYTAIGTTTNVAHRLQAIARPGEVILGPRTQQLAGNEVSCIPLEPVHLKGLSAPLPIWTYPG